MVTEPPDHKVAVLIAAPHTSNWDFPLMLAMAWKLGLNPRWLGKQEMFFGPLKWIWPKLGGVPVDRDNPKGLVDDLVASASASDHLAIVVPAEGTRSKGDYWKSGFYRIAKDGNLPLLPSFLDGPTRSGGIGPAIPVTGDIGADMDVVRAFYADKRGVKPANKTEPRLRDEERTAGDD